MIDFSTVTGETTDPFILGRGNAQRDRKRAQHVRRFVGVDGEGISWESERTYEIPVPVKRPDGHWIMDYETRHYREHAYVLLSVGDKSFHKNGEELTTDEIFQFLWNCYLEDPEPVYVGYFLDYDFTEWFKGLPEETAKLLLSQDGIARRRRKFGRNSRPFPVRFGRWDIDIHAGKRFKIRPHKDKSNGWMVICDVGAFFQKSFLAVIADWPGICTPAELEKIERGKAHRDVAQFDKEMVEYNQLENLILSRVMEKLNEGFAAMGVLLNKDQWYGPGQAAQKWLLKIHAPERRDVAEWVPERVLLLALASYYGGWFIITAHGHIPGLTYEYDRNSAYPFEIARLPCLSCGTWETLKRRQQPTDICLVDCTVTQKRTNKSRLGSMPYRTKGGMILQPRNTRGVYWWREIEAARRAGCIDKVTIHEAWQFTPRCDHKPFAEIAHLYEQRRSVGKKSPMGVSLKLVYNSSYGKLAQSVGEPRFANPIYASLITSGCRTEIWNAIATHPRGTDAVTMVATDAVFFTSEHPGLTLSDSLGDWSLEIKENLTQFMPGLYWDDATRKSKTGKVRSRGVKAGDLRDRIEYLDYCFEEHKQTVWERQQDGTWLYQLRRNESLFDDKVLAYWATYKFPSVTIPIQFGMVSARLALHRGHWKQAGRLLETRRILSADPTWKRDATSAYVSDDICWTMPYRQGFDGIKSAPYEKRFGMQLRIELLENESINPNGTTDSEIYDYVGGTQENVSEVLDES